MTDEHINSGTLIDYLHGELAPEHDADVHAHLAGCTSCMRAYDAEARLTEHLRAQATAAERDLPAGVVARLRAQLDAPPQPLWLQGLNRFLRPAVSLPAAAALILAAALGFSVLRPSAIAAPTIAASYYLDDHAALSTQALPFTQTPVVPESLEPGSATNAQSAAITVDTIARE